MWFLVIYVVNSSKLRFSAIKSLFFRFITDVSIDDTIKSTRDGGKRLIEKYEEKLRKYQVAHLCLHVFTTPGFQCLIFFFTSMYTHSVISIVISDIRQCSFRLLSFTRRTNHLLRGSLQGESDRHGIARNGASTQKYSGKC